MNHGRLSALVLAAGMAAGAFTAGGCHTVWQCPILQGMAGYTIKPPLPPESGDYTIVGYRDGIRFYVLKFNDNLYRGGDILSEQGAAALKALGIRTIISTNPSDKERELAARNGFNLVEIPFSWAAGDLTREDLDRFLSAFDAGPKPVYVKDRMGTIEAGLLVAHYRIQRDGWSYDRAIKEFDSSDGPDMPGQGNYWDTIGVQHLLKDAAPPDRK